MPDELPPKDIPVTDEYGITYIKKIPAAVPEGKVLVHNNIRPTSRLGSRGFRAWLQPLNDRLEPCGCIWASELPTHYRVIRAEPHEHQ